MQSDIVACIPRCGSWLYDPNIFLPVHMSLWELFGQFVNDFTDLISADEISDFRMKCPNIDGVYIPHHYDFNNKSRALKTFKGNYADLQIILVVVVSFQVTEP